MDTRLTKSYYKIKEVVEIIGIPASTLRYWEKEFPEITPRRSEGNQRYYSPADIEVLNIINYLLNTKGMKIKAAKEYLHSNRLNISKRVKIIEKLKTVREDLNVLLQSLNLRGQKLGLPEQ